MIVDDPKSAVANLDYEPLRLQNQLCFALYAATRSITQSYRPLLGDLGLTYPQYLVLLVLWEQDRQTISDIGRKLLLDSGTLTPVVKRLERAGIVTRTRRPADEREVEIQLTAEGWTLRDRSLGVREAIVCRLGMTELQIAALRQELEILIGRLNGEPYSTC